METREYVVALRDLADWYEAHPEAPVPSDRRFYAWGSTREQVRSVVRASGGVATERRGVDQAVLGGHALHGADVWVYHAGAPGAARGGVYPARRGLRGRSRGVPPRASAGHH